MLAALLRVPQDRFSVVWRVSRSHGILRKRRNIMVQFVKKFWKEEEGVTAIEYGLLAALIAVAIIVGATALGTNLNAIFSWISGKVAPPAAN